MGTTIHRGRRFFVRMLCLSAFFRVSGNAVHTVFTLHLWNQYLATLWLRVRACVHVCCHNVTSDASAARRCALAQMLLIGEGCCAKREHERHRECARNARMNMSVYIKRKCTGCATQDDKRRSLVRATTDWLSVKTINTGEERCAGGRRICDLSEPQPSGKLRARVVEQTSRGGVLVGSIGLCK